MGSTAELSLMTGVRVNQPENMSLGYLVPPGKVEVASTESRYRGKRRRMGWRCLMWKTQRIQKECGKFKINMENVDLWKLFQTKYK